MNDIQQKFINKLGHMLLFKFDDMLEEKPSIFLDSSINCDVVYTEKWEQGGKQGGIVYNPISIEIVGNLIKNYLYTKTKND